MTLNKEISDLGKVHILGLGGAGMSGIARLLSAQGVEVSGTDAKESRRLEALRKIGVNVFVVVVPALGAVDWYPANALFICSITFLSLRSNVLPPFAFENDFWYSIWNEAQSKLLGNLL